MFLKLQLKIFKFLILTGFLFLGGQSFSQDQADQGQQAPVSNQQELDEQKIEDHNTQDLEQLLKRYNKDSEKVLNDSDKLHKEEVGTEVKDTELENMRPTVDPMKMSSEAILNKAKADVAKRKLAWGPKKNDYSGAIRKVLEPLQKLSEEELLKKLDEQTENSSLRPYMDKYPNINIFTVKLIKDENAIPSIAKIVEDRDRLINFFGVLLGTVILGYFVKKLFHREGRSFLMAVFYFLIRIHVMFAIRCYVIYFFYSEELTPAAKIFKQVFM